MLEVETRMATIEIADEPINWYATVTPHLSVFLPYKFSTPLASESDDVMGSHYHLSCCAPIDLYQALP